MAKDIKRKKTKVIRDGFGYLEGFRWHEGEVWFSDIQQGKVFRMSPDGEQLNVVAEAHVGPSGLGFPPDDQPFVVGLEDATLRRILPDTTTEVIADLSDLAIGPNDMWVDTEGRAYISQIGFNFPAEPVQPSRIIVRQPDGTLETTAEGIICPNGIQVTSDGKTLIVAESFAFRLSAFDIGEDGLLSNKRIIKQYEDTNLDVLDGLVLDAEGAAWVAMPFRGEVQRITQDGEVTDIVEVKKKGHFAITCTLGGPDKKTLFVAAADTEVETLFEGTARVEAIEVEIPGVV